MSENLEQKISACLAEKDFDLAFKFILEGYKERLYWHIRHLVLVHEDADDILQDVFVKIWKNLDKFEGRSQVYSWMYRIASNEALGFLAAKKRKSAVQLDYHPSVANVLLADSFFDGNEMEALLHAAVSTLPDKQKLIFTMRYFEEMKYEAISEITETSVGALKASFHHAVKKIETFIRNKSI